MSDLRSKSPAENYATRQSEAKPNIGHPGSTIARDTDDALATAALAANTPTNEVTAVDATVLRAAVDAALVVAGASAGEKTAAADALTNALVLAGCTFTVAPAVTIIAAR